MFLRLFDVNFDGFIDKKEFRWMTTSELVSWKTIDLVFEVGTFLRWMLATLQAFPAAHVLIEDDLKYAANDPQYAEQRGRLVDCNAKATHRCRNCKTVEFFPLRSKQLQFSSPCQRCDLDRNGKLDYQEFKAMIFRSRERKEALLREEQEQARRDCQKTTFLFI